MQSYERGCTDRSNMRGADLKSLGASETLEELLNPFRSPAQSSLNHANKGQGLGCYEIMRVSKFHRRVGG